MSYLSYTKPYNNNLLMLLVNNHKRYLPIVTFFDNMTHSLTELSWLEAELIAKEISKANQSAFCTGIREAMLEALDTSAIPAIDEKLKVVISFALKLNHQAASISQSDINTVLDQGWSEQTIEEIVALVAIQNLYNTIATGLGFKQIPKYMFKQIGMDTVSKGSYSASFNQFIQASI